MTVDIQSPSLREVVVENHREVVCVPAGTWVVRSRLDRNRYFVPNGTRIVRGHSYNGHNPPIPDGLVRIDRSAID